MKKKQFNKLNMYTAVYGALQQNKSDWAKNDAMVRMIDQFNGLYSAIQRALFVQKEETKPITQNKHYLKEHLIEEIMAMSGYLAVIAKNQRDILLKGQLQFSASTFRRSHELDFWVRVEAFVALVDRYKLQLEEAGITPVDFDELNRAVEEYKPYSAAPRHAISVRLTVTQRIAELFGEMDSFLKDSLDRSMIKLGRNSPEFLRLYRQSRKLKHVLHPIRKTTGEDDSSPPGGD
ncbi:MAG: hypothetical protein KDC12_15765 [Flavobacteriales bacterium]|nr:hypothetical protein [Flavobacteriales bacterium]